jgi:hypothetical protein
MTRADLLLVDGSVHTLSGDPAADPEPDAEAVAVRDGRVVGVGQSYDVSFRGDVETRTVALDGATVLPGLIDAHTHLTAVGRRLVHADLGEASDRDEALARLSDRAAELAAAASDTDEGGDGAEAGDVTTEWVLGFGYDESTWPSARYLDRRDLDAVSQRRPVAAIREDMHVASLNGVALDRLADRLPASDVRHRDGEPSGVVVEDAVQAVFDATEPDYDATRDLVDAAQRAAVARGLTGVHDMVRRSHAPRVYRDLAAAGDLDVRVRLNYWSDHLDALVETGHRTNHGSDLVRVGAIKTYTDGSIGGRTAKLSRPYDDWPGDGDGDENGDPTGEWVVAPDELRRLVERADAEGFQVAAHAIGDEAIDAVVDAFAAVSGDATTADDATVRARHRIEHVELATDDAIDRMAELGVVASMQPNFHRWAADGGLYDARLGDRRVRTNRLRRVSDAGVPLAFGSDCMPMDPLYGLHQAVTAPTEAQSLPVSEAVRAYTQGAAYAGFDEDRLGTIEPGARADFTVLDGSPWDHPESIADLDVLLTIVDGRVVYDGR